MTYNIQKATEFAQQSAAFRKQFCLEDLAVTHQAQPKYDGCHLIVDTSTMTAFSRTDGEVRSCDHIIDEVADHFGQGWVVQGEAWNAEWDFPRISGAYRQHAPEVALQFVAYDCLPSQLFHLGFDRAPYRERLRTLQQALDSGSNHVSATTTYNPGTYIIRQLAEQYKARGGYDGIILRNLNAPWVRGDAREGELVKVKPSLSIDLLVVGFKVTPGAKTGREVVTLLAHYKGQDVWVGSGVPHGLVPQEAVGQIMEVEAMGVTAKGVLREPRFKGIRIDKVSQDV